MDYGQYTSASLSRHEDDYDLSLREPQAQDQDQDQRGEREQYLQDQDCPQAQEQVLQVQPQVHHQQQQLASEVQLPPQLDQSQLHQLHLQQQQRQLEYFAQLTSSPQVQIHQTLPIQASSTSTPTLGFIAPPPPLPTGHSTSPAAEASPWDSPTSVFGGLTDAQLAAAMSMVASAGVAGVYGHEYGVGRDHAARSQQHNGNNATTVLPPITTLEMVEGARSTSTPGSVCSNLPPTPASSTAMMASPVAVRSEFGVSGPQVQIQDGAQEEDQEHEEGQVQYEPPRVIQLVERPQRKSRAAAQAARQQQQNGKAQASSKSATQAKVGVAHAHRQSQRQSAKQQQQEQSEVQVQKKRKEQQMQATSASASSVMNTLQIQQRQQQPTAKQTINSSSNSNPSSSIPPVLATTVPSPSQWYGIHALATASHQRVGPNISSSSSPVALKNSNNANVDVMPNSASKQSAKPNPREAGYPYPPWLRQRRTVSGPATFTSTSTGNGINREDVDVNMDGGEDGIDAPSPSRSLPTRSPVPETPHPTSDGGPTRFFSAPPSHYRPHPTLNHHPPITTKNTSNAGGPRYLVRTDLHYDIPSNTLTAMLEVPGVPSEGIRIALCNDARNGARMLVVRGRMRRVLFPSPGEKRGDEERDEEAGYVVKERKCGEFKRVLIVPQETKREDIKVSMADGILFLRYPAGEQIVNINGSGAGSGTLTMTTKSKPADETMSSNILMPAVHTSNTTPDSRASSKPNSKNSDSVQTPAGSRSHSRPPSKASTPAPNTTSQSTAGGGNTSTSTGGMQYNFRVQTTAPTTMPGSGT
ncbi:hypothetical protein ACEPAH_1949 [Sanghuangporus vaninii]